MKVQLSDSYGNFYRNGNHILITALEKEYEPLRRCGAMAFIPGVFSYGDGYQTLFMIKDNMQFWRLTSYLGWLIPSAFLFLAKVLIKNDPYMDNSLGAACLLDRIYDRYIAVQGDDKKTVRQILQVGLPKESVKYEPGSKVMTFDCGRVRQIFADNEKRLRPFIERVKTDFGITVVFD